MSPVHVLFTFTDFQKLEREARICRYCQHPNIGKNATHIRWCLELKSESKIFSWKLSSKVSAESWVTKISSRASRAERFEFFKLDHQKQNKNLTNVWMIKKVCVVIHILALSFLKKSEVVNVIVFVCLLVCLFGRLQRNVIINLLFSDFQKLEREARICRNLHHPNIGKTL